MTAPLPLARRRKALARLAQDGAVLAPQREGVGHGVYPRGDRRRRPLARLTPEDVQALALEGAISPSGIAGCWLLSGPGRARVRREAAEDEAFLQQHAPRIDRTVMEGHAVARTVRGVDPAGPVARLARLSDSAGMAFFSGREIAAARRLWEEHERAQRGLLRGSDWSAPPLGSTARGPGGAQEGATLSAMAAREAVAAALNGLPRTLSAAVKAFLLDETGLETLERAARWPQRSGKLALKIALDLLADHYGAA
ncbi:MAG: DUF6456 domain-containing protein [Hyphomonadaceae bacterium]|nr:DUF6456 domain-containing protein [Hyphomonadaceae bacterium]